MTPAGRDVEPAAVPDEGKGAAGRASAPQALVPEEAATVSALAPRAEPREHRQLTLFLERRSYRRRRMMDALRLLPILGVGLFMLPLFWPSGAEQAGAVPMSTAVIYVFSAWAVLILCALVLWRAIWRGPIRPAESPETQAAEAQAERPDR